MWELSALFVHEFQVDESSAAASGMLHGYFKTQSGLSTFREIVLNFFHGRKFPGI